MTHLFLVDRNIELSNLDDIYDMSRQSLIWVGFYEIECLELGYLETFQYINLG
jgi:hypothetical protein